MLWAYILAVALGATLGLRFKVHAVAVGSLAILLGGTVLGAVVGWSVGWAFLVAFGATFAFQCGYFLALSVICLARQQPHKNAKEQADTFDDALTQTRVPSP